MNSNRSSLNELNESVITNPPVENDEEDEVPFDNEIVDLEI